ncbi:20331_t:CDS:1, partial [Gigaspora rosea]
NTNTTGTRKDAIVESLEIQIENFVTQYICNSNTGDDSTIAFMLFTNQHGSFKEAYDNFLRTEFSITPDTEITNHMSNLDWRVI